MVHNEMYRRVRPSDNDYIEVDELIPYDLDSTENIMQHCLCNCEKINANRFSGFCR